MYQTCELCYITVLHYKNRYGSNPLYLFMSQRTVLLWNVLYYFCAHNLFKVSRNVFGFHLLWLVRVLRLRVNFDEEKNMLNWLSYVTSFVLITY